MKPIILIGGGGHCKSVIEAIESCGQKVFGILDIQDKVGQKILNYDIIGTDESIPQWVDKAEFLITVGQIKSSIIRKNIEDKIIAAGGVMATIVASTANVSRHAVLSTGTIVMHGVMVNAGAIIGRNCIINTLANIDHDAAIGDNCHISTGAMVNGDCIVEADSFLGSGSILLNGVSIAGGSLISAGAVVRKSIMERGIYAGNPAKLIKKF